MCVCVCARACTHHISSSSIPTSRGEKNVRSRAARPTGGSAFCGALEDGMGDVLVSATNQHVTQTQQASLSALRTVLRRFIRRKRASRRPDGWTLGSRNARKRQTGRSARLQEWNQFQSASAIDVRLVKAVMRSGGQRKNLILAEGDGEERTERRKGEFRKTVSKFSFN